MHFTEHYRQLLLKPHPFGKLWLRSWILGGVIFCLFCWYLILTGGSDVWLVVNQALAETAMVLIGLSMAMSGICYFWNFADHYIIYRKYLGVTGWGLVLGHGLYSGINYWLSLSGMNQEWLARVAPAFDFYHVWNVAGFEVSNVLAFASGLASLLIFTMMAGISNQWAVQKLGGKTWRYLLRLGYLAYFLGFVHFGIKRMGEWVWWLTHFEPIWPPLSLLTAMSAALVFGLRFALLVALMKKKENNVGS